MPLVQHHRKKHHMYIKGHRGGSLLLDVAQHALINSGLPWDKIFSTIGGLTYGALTSYGIHKVVNHFTKPKNGDHMPLSVSPAPQGTLKGDILPVKNDIQVVNPENHYIDLPDGRKVVGANQVIVEPQAKIGYGMMKKKTKKGGRVMGNPMPSPGVKTHNLDNILNNKSQQILQHLRTGSGIMKMM